MQSITFTSVTHAGGIIGEVASPLTMSQVAVLEEVSFQVAPSSTSAVVGCLVAIQCRTLSITDSFCRASCNSVVSPVKNFFKNYFYNFSNLYKRVSLMVALLV